MAKSWNWCLGRGEEALFVGSNGHIWIYHATKIRQPTIYCWCLITVLKLNAAELRVLQEILHFEGGAGPFITYLRKRFEIEVIALTDGADGSQLSDWQNRAVYVGPQSVQVVDTVGAGDAFAAMLAIGYLQRWDFDTILALASDFAAAVCTIKGAVPEEESFYEPFRQRIAKEGTPQR